MLIHTMLNENTAAARQCALPEQTMVYGVLGELKRTAMEYTAAALNASNMDIRRTFERLANETLRAHEQLVGIMSQNQMYEGSPAALVHEVQRQAQRCSDSLRSVQLFMRENLLDATTQESQQAGAAGMAGAMGTDAMRNIPQYEPAQTAGRYSMPAAAQTGTRYGFGGGGQIGMGAPGAGVGPAGPYAMNQRPPAFASYAPAPQQQPFHSAQPPRNEPTGSAIADSGNFAAGYGQSGAPRLPEFAQPHASPFGGLQQGHYAQIQSSYTAAGIPDQHPYSMAGETMNQRGSSGYGQQSAAAPVGGTGAPGVHPSPVKPTEAPQRVSEGGAQKASAAAAATSANAETAAQGEATAPAATSSSTKSSSTTPSALSVAEDIGASAPATKRGRRSKTADKAGAAGGDKSAAAEISYG